MQKIEIKQLAIVLKDQNKRNQEIIAKIRKRYKIKLPSSTVSTWYNAKNRERIRNMGVDHITGTEVRVNQLQRTRHLIDTEHFLMLFIERQQDKGVPMTTTGIQMQARLIYNKLIETRICNTKGEH